MPAGAPRIIKSPEEMLRLYIDYVDFCDNKSKMPNIAGFCRFITGQIGEIFHRQRFYDYADYPEFADTIKSIDEWLEDDVLNSKAQKELIRLAYLNTKCGYSQKIDIQAIPAAPPDPVRLQEELRGYIADMSDEQKQQLLGP